MTTTDIALSNAVGNGQPLTMSSREIAELCDKRHDNVKRTIETLADQGVIARPQIEDVPEKSGNGASVVWIDLPGFVTH